MSDRRIPISLKVPEDDFYYEFVEPRRASKELSPFIYQILRAYYEDDGVKEAVKPHLQMPGEDKVEFFSRELERIAMEHSATVMDTMALQDEIEVKKNTILTEVQQTYGGTSEDVDTSGEKKEAPLMIGTATQPANAGEGQPVALAGTKPEGEVAELRMEVSSIKKDFDNLSKTVNSNMEAILKALNIGVQPAVAPQPTEVVAPPVQTVNVVEQVAASQPNVQPQVAVNGGEAQAPQVAQPEPVASVVTENTGNTTVTDTPAGVSQQPSTVTQENNVEKEQGKPADAAFGKLLGSLSNKG